jgi:peptidoglycan/LPS O-acetylase OafA/YrhL
MKSSSGEYYIGLDHIRALAVLLVFCWHFVHINDGQLAPPPAFPLSLLAEGHTGVAIFMCLSGYLFAKLLDGKRIDYPAFIWNRFLRLAPLLAFVLILVGIKLMLAGTPPLEYAWIVISGLVAPSLPNGGWSITAEFHFYLILPLLLFLKNRWKFALLIALLGALVLRMLLHNHFGEVHELAYFTIVGRIDQFLLGIFAFQFRELARGRHILAGGTIILFAVFFWCFDSLGGYYKNPSFPSPSPIWIYMPTIEGITYALLIAWYDTSFRHPTGPVSRFIASIGTYSYSIYLLHFFVVFELARVINSYVWDLSNIHTAILFAVLSFVVMVPIGSVSYRMIELPCLAYRKKYILPAA